MVKVNSKIQKNNKTVVLVSPPSRMMNHYRPPLALMYISGYLKQQGIQTQIVDSIMESQTVRGESFFSNKKGFFKIIEDQTIQQISKIDTDIIGITCYTPEVDEVEQLAHRIKSIKPNAKIVAGGIHPTLYPDDLLGPNSDIDFVIFGEGEISLHELVVAIRLGKDIHKLKGVGFYDRSTSKKVITERQLLDYELDSISCPDYEGIDMSYYTNASPYAIRGVFTRSMYLSASRGCPSSCTFCVAPELRDFNFASGIKKNAGVRLRTPKHLFEEVAFLKEKYKIDSFYFIDDLFTLDEEMVSGFCELMIKNKMNLVWGCSSKVNTVDYNSLKHMKAAGCIQLDFGVEKASDEQMHLLKKGTKVREVKETFKNCHELGIRAFANMLINTPGETEQDLKDTVGLLEEIKPNIVSINIFTPYPGTEIFSDTQGLTREEYPLLMENPAKLAAERPDKFRFAKHNIDLGAFASQEMKRHNKVYPNISIFFNPKYIRSLWHSQRKLNYTKQTNILVQEFINQKF
ncbi:MAG: radical SAM protein [Nitrospina sp.]|jgi:anaerobic magnesium-protoporphyrin IX monomethyl ester cyclase|nr:radical SAM protein [Nitrospina sp.]